MKLQDCISSISRQTFKDYEVWIVDNISTDGTKEFLQNLKPPFFSISEKDQGIYDAMNKGIEKARGEWLYFLGSDDQLFEAITLKDVSRYMTYDRKLLIGNVVYQESKKNPFILSKKKLLKETGWSWRIWIWNTLHHQGTFFHQSIFDSKKYSLKYPILADYFLNLTLRKEKITAHHINKIIAKCDPSGISKQGGWKLYLEEAKIKIDIGIKILMPLYYLMSIFKYSIRKLKDVAN